MVITLTELGELPVAAAAADQRDAKRQAVRPDRAGHRQGGIVEQVDEVGVFTQAPVELDRVGLHGGHAVVRGCGRHHQQVQAGPQGIGLLAEQLELGLRVIEVGRAELFTIGNDAAHRLDHRSLLGVKERADGGVALGHQRAAVEQLCSLFEGRKVQPHRLSAHAFKACHSFFKSGFGQAIAKKLQLVGHAKHKAGWKGLAV